MLREITLLIAGFAALSRLFNKGTAFLCCFTASSSFLLLRFVQFRAKRRLVQHIPHTSYALTPWDSVLTLFLPPIKYVNSGVRFKFNDARQRLQTYTEVNSTIRGVVTAFKPRIQLRCADIVAIKAIMGDRKLFSKPLKLYRILAVYGENVLVTEGNEWRLHRKIVGPAFSETTNALSWQHSTKFTKTCMQDFEKRADENGVTYVQSMPKFCLQIALAVLCAVAFGVNVPGPGEPVDNVPLGHRYNFQDALVGAMETLLVTVATPGWIAWLPTKAFKRAKMFKQELDQYMLELIAARKKSIALGDEGKDLVSALIKGNNASQKEGESMNKSAMVGNFFIFLVAGHETSAHTLSFALGLLALYPDEQDKLFEQLVEIIPDPDQDAPYSDYGLFTRAIAIFHETLRLYPAVIDIPKQVSVGQDTILPCSERGPGGATSIFVPKGTFIDIDVQTVHHDPYYWPNPEEFQPDRFIDTKDHKWNREAFIPFSAGARSCPGQKFATVEAVAILVNLCRRYRVALHPDDIIPNESLDARTSRVLRNVSKLTLTPLNLGLCFHRR